MQSASEFKSRSRMVVGLRYFLAIILCSVVTAITALALQPGDLDPTFDGDGKLVEVLSPLPQATNWYNDAHAVAIQSNGKIVVAGEKSVGNSQGVFILARYNLDGSLDTTFGYTGMVVTDVPVGYPTSIAVQPDGKIVVAGGAGYFVLVRYNANGSLDTTFGSNGIVTTIIGNYLSALANSVAIQSDGKILAGGGSDSTSILVRYNGNGSLDTTFGGSGILTRSNGYDISSVVIQTDGKIITTGYQLVRYNVDGSLDPTWGNGGIQASAYGTHISSIQSDGKLVVAGDYLGDFIIVRYNANGFLDPTFGGGDGIVGASVGDPPHSDRVSSVAIGSDGKIVVAGSLVTGTAVAFAVVRLNSDGSLDSTLDSDGKVITPIGQVTRANSVAIEPGGKIIVAGVSVLINGGSDSDFALARYNPNGSLDSSFDSDGIVISDAVIPIFPTEQFYGITVQSDGKIVAAGSQLARYNGDGSPDASFGNGTGKVAVPANDVVIQPDGKIVLSWGDQVSRRNSDGSSDTAFGGGNGRVFTTIDDRAVVMQSDGKIVVAGTVCVSYDDEGGCLEYNFALVRITAGGSLDPSFDGDGKVTTAIGTSSEANSVAIQADGKIVVAGTSFNDSTYDFALARYNTDGSLDTSFDVDGIVTTPVGTNGDIAESVAIQSDRKIVVAGLSYGDLNNSDFALSRYNIDGSLDTSLDEDGKVLTPIGIGEDQDIAYSVMIQPDGKIVAAGSENGSGNGDFALVRYNSNGSLDSTFGGGDGISTVDFDSGSNDRAFGMALDGQGRAVLAGESAPGFAIARFLLGGGKKAAFDFDGDGKADIAVRRPSDNVWYLLRTTAGYTAMAFGVPGDLLAPADYDGDGKADIAVFRPSDSQWYIAGSSSGFYQVTWGVTGDIPVPADYDGDGKDDVAIYRPSNGTWYIIGSHVGLIVINFGTAEDKPYPADYDGDGRADLAVRRPSDNNWYLLRTTDGFTSVTWGVAGDLSAPADYDGDGKTDLAVFRPSDSTWYIFGTTRGIYTQNWGTVGDVPVAADFDGDGKSDVAVFRPSNGTWYIIGSSAEIVITTFGQNGDTAVPSAFSY